MPKIVDHDRQRETFAKAAIRLIARHGLEGVTMRAVAKEASLSYGSLFHYFDSKDELLMHAVAYATSQQGRRVSEYSSREKGLQALRQLLCDDAIIDESSRDNWTVWMTFLCKAAVSDEFADMNRSLIDGWLDRIRRMLVEAQQSGEVRPGLDIEHEALAIWAFSSGLGQVGLLQPELLPPGTQKQLISDYLAKLQP